MSSTSLRDFIQSLLKQTRISEEFIIDYTDEESMKIFQNGVTHSSFDSDNNYEVLEFIGDGIIKAINSQYIPKRFGKELEEFKSKNGTSVGALSKARRILEQEKMLSKIALKLGFWNYVRASQEILSYDRNKTLEDVFEAFIGAMVQVIDYKTKPGIGYYFAKKFLEAQLNTIQLELTEQTLDDPITRLNELYKANVLTKGAPLKWGDAQYIETQLTIPRVEQLPTIPTKGYLVFNTLENTIYGGYKEKWVRHDQLPIDLQLQPDPTLTAKYNKLVESGNGEPKDYFQRMWMIQVKSGNGKIIGMGISFRKKDAKMTSARMALEYLKKLGYEK